MPRRHQENPVEENTQPETRTSIVVRPLPKTLEQSLLDYVSYFERVINANMWGNEEAGRIFSAMLPVGERVLDILPINQGFTEIKDVIDRMDEPYREAKLQELMSIEMKGFEKVHDYFNRVTKLVDAVYNAINVEGRKQITRDFFIHGLPTSVKEGVLQSNVKTLEEAINAAKLVVSLKGNQVVSTIQTKPNEEQHEVHRKSAERAYGPWKKRTIRCFQCKGWGHVQSVCPSNRGNRNVNEIENNGDQGNEN